MTTTVEFFFDPVRPWAWITSRWAVEVAEQRELEIRWRFLSLWLLNADRDYATQFPEEAVLAAGLPVELAAAQDDDRFDSVVAEETKLAVDRAGPTWGRRW
jgi:predicted DsbA family dithiol-disulfide isomerase